MKNNIPVEENTATPSAGARQPAGKSSMPDANLGLHAVKFESARTAEEDKGAALRCINKQIENDGGVAWDVRNTDNFSSKDNDL